MESRVLALQLRLEHIASVGHKIGCNGSTAAKYTKKKGFPPVWKMVKIMEKKIIEGKLEDIKGISMAFFAFIAVFGNYFLYKICELSTLRLFYGDLKKDWVVEKYGENATYFSITIQRNMSSFILLTIIPAVIALLFYFIFSKTELIVTDKRVYGKTSWGKRVDLPFDSISAVGTAMMKTIAIRTSSGAIKFSLIKNRNEVHSEISKLLIERQENKKSVVATVIKQETSQSNADELKKYKDLLDAGVISQEEFDLKKKQLLGL